MTTPSPFPEKSTSGITVDPKTLKRVVPESRRPDGRFVHNAEYCLCLNVLYSIRKEIKIRPGFTPREDITRFRSARQTEKDRIALPAGHILGWVAPSSASKPKPSASGSSPSKSAKKNEKKKAKREKMRDEAIRAHWDDDSDGWAKTAIGADGDGDDVVKDPDGTPNWAKTTIRADGDSGDGVVKDLGGAPNTAKTAIKADGDGGDGVVKDPGGIPNTAETASKADRDGGDGVVKDPGGAPNTAKTAIKADWDDGDDVVKDPDGAPNWAKTAEVQDRNVKPNTSGKLTATEGNEGSSAGRISGDEEPPTSGAEALDQKLEHLTLTLKS